MKNKKIMNYKLTNSEKLFIKGLSFTSDDGGNFYKLIGERIYKRRMELNISQEAIASELGVRLNYWKMIEKGELRVFSEFLKVVCTFLHTDDIYLLIGLTDLSLKTKIEDLNNYISLFNLFSSLSSDNKKLLFSVVLNKND